jgi:predicted MFS family arabinose efflux permease
VTSPISGASEAHRQASSAPRAGSHAYYILFGLFLVLTFSLVDRNILSILLVDIKAEFQASDTAMGFLTGLAFAVTNAIAGIPLARLADRRSRTLIVSAGLAVWSALTALQGMAQSILVLALARIGVGIGEASTGPASHSLLSDLFSPARRATAIAVYTMGGHFGVLIGMVVGGWLNENFGWRMALVAVGLPGLFVALVFAFTMREPVRGQSEARRADESQEPLGQVVRYLWSKKTYRHLMIAGPLFVSAFYALNIWGPAFLIRVHGLTTAEVGVRLGPILGIGGALGTLLGGYVCDRIGAKDPRAYVVIPGINGLLMLPFLAGFLMADDSNVALLCLAPMVFLASTFLGPLYAVALGLAKLRMRAMASAILHLAISIVAAGLVPQLIGVLNDLLSGRFGDEAVRFSLGLVLVTNLWGAAHAFLAARSIQADFIATSVEDASGAG